MTDPKPDFVLSDGREIFFDFDKINYGEWLAIFEIGKAKKGEPTSDELLCRVYGITPEEQKLIGFKENRRLFNKFLKAAREPLSDPND